MDSYTWLFVTQIFHNGQLYYSKFKTICFIHNKKALLNILSIIKSSDIIFNNYNINLIKTNIDDNQINWNDNGMSCNCFPVNFIHRSS